MTADELMALLRKVDRPGFTVEIYLPTAEDWRGRNVTLTDNVTVIGDPDAPGGGVVQLELESPQ